MMVLKLQYVSNYTGSIQAMISGPGPAFVFSGDVLEIQILMLESGWGSEIWVFTKCFRRLCCLLGFKTTRLFFSQVI